jgi:menaquinone-dependent protoporphyrinogen oxidase
MRTAIIYCTTHGCTEKCAAELQQHLKESELFNLKKNTPKNLGEFDTIILGGSIHAGHVQRRIKTFCEKNQSLLTEKKLGLFLCCMEEGEKAQEQFDNAFPEVLRQHAATIGFFGGEFDFDKMGFMAKAIVKKVANVEESVDRIAHDSIKTFAQQMTE